MTIIEHDRRRGHAGRKLRLALGTLGGQFGLSRGVSGTSGVGACFQDGDLLIELPPHVLHESEVLRLCFFEGERQFLGGLILLGIGPVGKITQFALQPFDLGLERGVPRFEVFAL